jgi:hypothetical protein
MLRRVADPMKAETSVTLDDGRTLTFVFDLNAWIDIGEELGKERGKDLTPDEVTALLTDKDNPPGLKFQRVMIWGGLRKYHPEMSVRDAGEVMVEASQAMEKAMAGGMPKQKEGSAGDADADPPKRRKRGTGTLSTSAGAA